MNDPSRPTVEDRQRILLETADTLVFKSLPDVEGPDLQIYLYQPVNPPKGELRPMILFFFSSGWDRGHVSQFAPQALHFAERGVVTALVEYRTAASHPGSTPIQAMQDVRSSIRWARMSAEELRVDPEKIIAAGGRAGGHMAATTAMNPDVREDGTDPEEIDGRPNGVVLFAPIIDLTRDTYATKRFETPAEAKGFSLSRFIDPGMPPMIIFHGTMDRFIPCESVRTFAKKLNRKKRNVCEFHPFDGREESFFNLNVDPFSYEAVLAATDQFLVNQGFLPENADEEGDARLISWRESDF
ncbi:MAG: alpha/beta hydrolase [Verrucomicrobiales bacterium]|nr:alpha/beta hydrolase [Verrucomicrobiales bacterium]